MKNDFNREVKLFMIFDILGDTVRTGPQLWHVNRERLEKNFKFGNEIKKSLKFNNLCG